MVFTKVIVQGSTWWLVLVEHCVLLLRFIELGGLLCNFLTRFAVILLD